MQFFRGKIELSVRALRVLRTQTTLVLASIGVTLTAAEWHVGTDGKSDGQGTVAVPWDLESTLAARQRVAPGDTIWVHAGRYKKPAAESYGFKVQLAGRPGTPIHVRAVRGERVTIDGGLNVQPPATHLWIWDIEIIVSEPRPGKPVPPDSTYQNVNRPWGGLNVYAGEGCKFINLVIHDNNQGVSWWTSSKDSELHGCIIYDNGWAGTDRGHGHAIYTQNKDGVKIISDCIMTGGFGYTLHAYGSARADVDNYLVEGNICYNAGTFLIGGGKPSHNIRVFTNFLHHVSMQLGYTAPQNEDCEVRGNVIANGGLNIKKFERVVNEDNLLLPDPNSPRPSGTKVVFRPNKYDPGRANVAVFNWEKKATVDVDAKGFLKAGDEFRLLNPRDFFGRPVVEGVCDGKAIRVPMGGEFAAFVLLK